MAPIIQTPRGRIIVTKNGTAKLIWNTQFRHNWQKRYTRAQQYVDSEVLRLSEPFTPLRTGMLVKSGTLGSDIGSGLVEWIAPYAKAQYYSARRAGSQTGPLRGPYWFERGKHVWKRQIIAGCRRLAGGG